VAVRTVHLLDDRTSTGVERRLQLIGAGRQLLVAGVDVVGGATPRLDLTLHQVDDVRHALDELTERRSQFGAWMPARQHDAVPDTLTHVTLYYVYLAGARACLCPFLMQNNLETTGDRGGGCLLLGAYRKVVRQNDW